jgi:hypothetical protein
MTLTVHLGVLNVPYSYGQKTTGEVADILEEKYHIMELFVEEIGADAIASAFEESAKDAVAALFAGAPAASLSLTLDATEEIATTFRIFIDQQELDGVVPGVPTAAALKGVNHRFAHPYAQINKERPSFRDTGLYQASMRVWTT